jgi:Asp-tRNA(Asn)/Glu-tRNA(Gln) amidotransferase A subunit family amidase
MKTAEDAAMVLNTIAGFDEKDSTSVDREVPDYTQNLNDSIKGLTIGLPKEFFADGLDDGVDTAIMAAVKEFEALGASVKEISLPNSKYAIPTYYTSLSTLVESFSSNPAIVFNTMAASSAVLVRGPAWSRLEA